jgi:hypothetical protein
VVIIILYEVIGWKGRGREGGGRREEGGGRRRWREFMLTFPRQWWEIQKSFAMAKS